MKTRCVENFAQVKMGSDGGFSAMASTDAVDRQGEIVLPTAFAKDLDGYRGNPVIIAAHTHRSSSGWPTVIGSASKIEVVEDGLRFDGRFAGTELAKTYRQLYEEGHMKAFSVGFVPMEGEMREIKLGPGYRRRDADAAAESKVVYVHTRVELLEISCVAVPANPEATMRDIDTQTLERMIDERVNKALETMCVKQMRMILERTSRENGIGSATRKI